MRWEIETEKGKYIVSATNTKDAVRVVRKKDLTEIKGVRLLPKNLIDKVKSSWRNWFEK
jgi:hypothetical protein